MRVEYFERELWLIMIKRYTKRKAVFKNHYSNKIRKNKCMKFFITPTKMNQLNFVLLFFFMTSCLFSQNDKTQNQANTDQRILGEVTLQKRGKNEYFFRDYHNQKEWSEKYPGVLIERSFDQNNINIHFFNEAKELKTKLILKNINPFLKSNFKPISEGIFNFEIHEPAISKDTEPTEYLTYFIDAHTNQSNGYTTAYYSLTALNKNNLLFQKSAILIIDENGEIINSLIANDIISASHLSLDGTLIAYQYGGRIHNPSSNLIKSQCRIFDFKQDKLVYTIQPTEKRRIRALVNIRKDDLVHVGYSIDQSNKGQYILDLLDLNKRTHYSKVFENNQFIKNWNRFKSYRGIVNNEVLKRITF